MPNDEQDLKDSEMSYTNYGLTPEEGNELQAQLDPGEWQSMLTVQQLLTSAPIVAPDAGFSNRVMSRLATRERVRAQRRSALGALAFGLGSMALIAFFIWSSPLAALADTSGWVTLMNGIASLIPAVTTILVLFLTFTGTEGGEIALLVTALFAFSLTLIWIYMVTRPALSSRPIRATEA